MSNIISTIEIYKTLDIFVKFPDKDYNIDELVFLNELSIPRIKMMTIIDSLHKAGYLTENWVVTDILDPNSKSEFRYKITNNGTLHYYSLQGMYQTKQDNDDYNDDYKTNKKRNRWLLISFGIFFAIAIIIVIIVNL